jgi:catalase
MAELYASLNFDGQMRIDANHGKNPQYVPNSFCNKFRPDAAETPYELADKTVSRKSHFYHEGSSSEYE